MSKKIKECLLNCVNYFSIVERENRKYKQYKKEYDRLSALSQHELSSVFVNTKATYEHKKNVFSFFLITILLSALTEISANLYKFFQKILLFAYEKSAHTEEIIKVGFIISAIVFFCVILLILMLLIYYLKELDVLNKKLLTIEEVRNKKQSNKRK